MNREVVGQRRGVRDRPDEDGVDDLGGAAHVELDGRARVLDAARLEHGRQAGDRDLRGRIAEEHAQTAMASTADPIAQLTQTDHFDRVRDLYGRRECGVVVAWVLAPQVVISVPQQSDAARLPVDENTPGRSGLVAGGYGRVQRAFGRAVDERDLGVPNLDVGGARDADARGRAGLGVGARAAVDLAHLDPVEQDVRRAGHVEPSDRRRSLGHKDAAIVARGARGAADHVLNAAVRDANVTAFDDRDLSPVGDGGAGGDSTPLDGWGPALIEQVVHRVAVDRIARVDVVVGGVAVHVEPEDLAPSRAVEPRGVDGGRAIDAPDEARDRVAPDDGPRRLAIEVDPDGRASEARKAAASSRSARPPGEPFDHIVRHDGPLRTGQGDPVDQPAFDARRGRRLAVGVVSATAARGAAL